MRRVYVYNIIGNDPSIGIAGEQWKMELREMLLHAHPDWLYGGIYEDTPGSTTRLIELVCQRVATDCHNLLINMVWERGILKDAQIGEPAVVSPVAYDSTTQIELLYKA